MTALFDVVTVSTRSAKGHLRRPPTTYTLCGKNVRGNVITGKCSLYELDQYALFDCVECEKMARKIASEWESVLPTREHDPDAPGSALHAATERYPDVEFTASDFDE